MKRIVVLCERENKCSQVTKNETDCLLLQSKEESLSVRYEQYAVQLYETIKSLLESRLDKPLLIQFAGCFEGEQKVFRGLGGMLKTANLENPNLLYQIIEFSREEAPEEMWKKLELETQHIDNQEIRYEKQERYVKQLEEEIADSQALAGTVEMGTQSQGTEKKILFPWKENGVYWITGGMGGLGFLFAKEIAEKTKHVTLILTGRSKLNEQKEEALRELMDAGANAVYRELDVTKKEEVFCTARWIEQNFGGINGILHCAGITKDNFIIHKSEEEFQSVIKPKVSGCVNLDYSTCNMPLDFIVFFSSQSGEEGNVGQADYATGNAFMDVYAEYRNILVKEGKRVGKTLSINWPLWEHGGMHLSKEMEERIYVTRGIVPLRTQIGLSVFYQALENDYSQVMVMEGNAEKLSKKKKTEKNVEQTEGTEDIAVVNSGAECKEEELQAKMELYLKKIISGITGLPVERIQSKEFMENYGIDSVMIMEMTDQLEQEFGTLSKTLFFEYRSIQEIALYFIKNYREKLLELFGLKQKISQEEDVQEEIVSGNVAKEENYQKETYQKTEPAKRTRFFKNPSKHMEQNVQTETVQTDDPIAIIGIAGKYPQADNLEEFWNNLCQGRDCITEIPKERWDYKLHYKKEIDEDGKVNSKWGGFINDVDKFDPLFFKMNYHDAVGIDPQERLFLQCAYETLEDAGYTPETLKKFTGDGLEENVGVFAGVMYTDYQLYGVEEQMKGNPIALNSITSGVANRVSYTFNFHGPSLTLNTMCSSSLLAIHLACQSIKSGECEMALAGGVNLSIHPNKYYLLKHNNFMSSKGKCEAFGADGDGYAPGEGVGAILLKPLSKAIEDNDQIYAVVRGSCVNHGGKTNGFTVPNPTAQTDVIRRALKNAHVNAKDISYVEAHGTGTALGDPIEMLALSNAYAFDTDKKQYCSIGSVKSNIGHLESAAGIASVTKVLLQMKYGKLVPSIHTETLNPHIAFEKTPFRVQRTLEDWKRNVIEQEGKKIEIPRIAGISAFGAGGTNVHMILEEYQNSDREEVNDSSPYFILLSGKDERALRERVQRLVAAIESGNYQEQDLNRIAYTLQVGREALDYRFAVSVSSLEELCQKLNAYLEGKQVIDGVYTGNAKESIGLLALFEADDDLKEVFHSWVKHKKYKQLLSFWAKGLEVDWTAFYKGRPPRKISLPTYPFAKERVWIPKGKNGDLQEYKPVMTGKEEMTEEVLFRETMQWIKQEFSKISEIPLDKIEEDVALEDYGIDSVLIKDMHTALEHTVGEVSIAIFFECQDLRALTEYLVEAKKERLVALFQGKEGAEQGSEEVLRTEGKSEKQPKEYGIEPLTQSREAQRNSDIAIIGMSGRYPGADNVSEFWENLKQGKDCITEIPKERWDYTRYYDKEKGKQGKLYGKWGGFINDADKFDPLFFKISPDHAEIQDPQERLFLESVYETLEDAGYTRDSLRQYKDLGLEGNVGVFVGATFMEYQFYGIEHQVKGRNVAIPGIPSSIANQVSYFYNFHGPSMTVDTMCSSSLTALHLACESIQNGDCKLAIAGGVNLSLHPNKYLFLSQNYFLSTKGRCESFGQEGDGYVPGEGVVSILLKPLALAEQDGDHIYGVIKASAINHGGKTNGYTVPNLKAQTGVIRKALKAAKINPRMVSYVEAHGTGTALGDPIEIAGLTNAFREYTNENSFCSIGSVKSNIGHLEAASGLAGVTKILLQMQHKQLVPSIHSDVLNENIHFENTPFYVQHTLEEWKRPLVNVNGVTREYPRIAGISAFGAGGANAHVVIEEYIPKEEVQPIVVTEENSAVILLSAKNKERLRFVAERLLAHIEKAGTEEDLASLAYTLQVGREAMEERLGFMVSSLEMLKEKLRCYVEGNEVPDSFTGYVKGRRENTQEQKMWQAEAERQWKDKQYGKLVESWVGGKNIDWGKLYAQSSKPHRISLPTYPFARIRCWLPTYEELERQEMCRHKKAHPSADECEKARNEQTGFRAKEKEGLCSEVKGAVLKKLIGMIAEDMKLEPSQLEPQDSLEEYGVDSIKAMILCQKLSTDFEDISVSVFLENETMEQIAEELLDRYPEECGKWIEKE